MRLRIILVLLLILCTAPVLHAQYQVVTTIGMIADVVQTVAGDKARVTGLIGSGIDPHLYKPTRSDIAMLMSADVVFYNGLLLEGKMSDALIRVASSGRKVYAVTELINKEDLLEPAEFEGHFDPHVWMDPLIWSKTATLIADKLGEFDSKNNDIYQVNAKNYHAKLAELATKTEAALATIPKEARILVTAHDAFNYFAKRYKFEVLGIQGISTESEAGVRDIELIVNKIVTNKVPAVFIESTVSDRNIKALIEGAKARGHSLVIGGQLFSDAMGAAGDYTGTYIGMIDHNVSTITHALGGKVSKRGLFGKLADLYVE